LTGKSFSCRGKFAGREMIVMVPFYAEPENEILNVQPGDIGYYPGRQTICIFYGDTTPFGYVSVFARIVERLDDLKASGDRLLRAGILPAQLVRVEPPTPGYPQGSPLLYTQSGPETGIVGAGKPGGLSPLAGPLGRGTTHVLGELQAYIVKCWQH